MGRTTATEHHISSGSCRWQSTICLGVDSVDFVPTLKTGTGTAGATEVDATQESELKAADHRDASQFTSRVPAGGASSVCLGTDISQLLKVLDFVHVSMLYLMHVMIYMSMKIYVS